MTDEQHFQALINMYKAAPINDFYLPKMEIESGKGGY